MGIMALSLRMGRPVAGKLTLCLGILITILMEIILIHRKIIAVIILIWGLYH